MDYNEIISIVEDLNENLNDVFYSNGLGFDFKTNGYSNIISFCGYCIYSDDYISTDEVGEAGGLNSFLFKRKINILIC